MSWLSDAVSGRSSAEKSSAKKRKAQAAAKAKAEAQRRARAKAEAAARQKQAEQQAAQRQAQAQQEAAEKARIAAEQEKIRQAQELSDRRVSEFNTALDSARQAGSKELQLLRVSGLESEDARVRELAAGLTENKATALDAPDTSVSAQKASYKKRVTRGGKAGTQKLTLGSLGGGAFTLGG